MCESTCALVWGRCATLCADCMPLMHTCVPNKCCCNISNALACGKCVASGADRARLCADHVRVASRCGRIVVLCSSPCFECSSQPAKCMSLTCGSCACHVRARFEWRACVFPTLRYARFQIHDSRGLQFGFGRRL